MRLFRAGLFAVVLTLAACSQKPSVAQPRFEDFIDSVAKIRIDPTLAIPGAQITQQSAGDPAAPTAGVVNVPIINVGSFGWTKFVPEKEETLASGEKLITVRTEICMRADGDNSSCMRPNVYRYQALMRDVGGEWKLAGATFTEVSLVR